MVTVEKAIGVWKSVDKTQNATCQGVEFYNLLSATAPSSKLPKKTSRLRSKILVAIGAVERAKQKDGDKWTSHLSLWFIKPKKITKTDKNKSTQTSASTTTTTDKECVSKAGKYFVKYM